MPTVALYGHRVEPRAPTGEGHYVRRLIAAIVAADPDDLNYVVGASPEPPGPEGTPAGVPVLRPSWPRKPLHAAWMTFHRPRVDRALRYPDLVHVLYPGCPVPSSAPIVYTIHDLMPLTSPEWFPRRERVIFARCTEDAVGRAAALIADSEATATGIRERLGVKPDRIRVVHLGVDDRFFVPPSPAERSRVCQLHAVQPGRFLVVLGAVSTRKNLLPLIDAIAQQDRSGRTTLLAIGPPGVGAEEAEDRVRRLGLEDSVRFTGWLPAADVVTLLAASAGLLHPSMDEGFGMTPLEAMACGVPTAVSNAGSLPEVTDGAALLVDPLDPDAWALATTRLVDDEDLRAELIERGHAQAARHTWARTAEETIGVHRSLLNP